MNQANEVYSLNNALSFYRESSASVKMHHDLVIRYIELQCLLIAVVAPHWAESVWIEILGKPTSIQQATFPEIPETDAALTAARKYISFTASNVNSAESLQLKKKAKGKETSFDPKKPKKLTVFMSERFPQWQQAYIDLLKEMWNPETNSVDDKALNGKIAKMGEMKKAMPFVQGLKKRLQAGEPANTVLERKLAFDEKAVLVDMIDGLKRSANLVEVTILAVEEGSKKGTDLVTGAAVDNLPPNAEGAVPGAPNFLFANVESS